jgi:hypothetical protein
MYRPRELDFVYCHLEALLRYMLPWVLLFGAVIVVIVCFWRLDVTFFSDACLLPRPRLEARILRLDLDWAVGVSEEDGDDWYKMS